MFLTDSKDDADKVRKWSTQSREAAPWYEKTDERIKVFHTENRGLSAARNLGLDEAHGDWIAFVDSDDWIEPDMYEALLSKAEETGADVVECGVFTEYRTTIIKYLLGLNDIND